MSFFDDVGSNLGNLGSSLEDLASPLTGKKTKAQAAADQQAQQNLANAQQAYSGLQLPDFSPVSYVAPEAAGNAVAEKATGTQAQAVGAGPSAMNNISVNPQYAGAQQAQLAALSNLAANGGRNAASDANLASIQQQENQNAKGQRDAILQSANMRGQGGSGASLLAQLTASQNATNNQSAQDLGVAGQQANTAISAGQAAAGIGNNLQNTSFNQQAQTAAANDAIAKFNAANSQGVNLYNAQAQNQLGEFNAQQGTGVNEFNQQQNQALLNARANAANQTMQTNNIQLPQQGFSNALARAGGQAGVDTTGLNYFNNQGNMASQAAGNRLSAYGQLGTSAATAANTPIAAGSLLAAAASGGRIPGIPTVHGDSPLNDIVPVKTSPGEVIVPRSLAIGGTPHDIGHFVKTAPPVHIPGAPTQGRDKEAMLSALKHMARR